MNTKMIAIKISLLLLAGLLSGNAAWAEGKAKGHSGSANVSCKVENRAQSGFTAPNVYEFGELKLKVEAEYDDKPKPGPNYHATFSLKAPGFIERDIDFRIGTTHTYKICGTEVSVHLKSGSEIEVSSF